AKNPSYPAVPSVVAPTPTSALLLHRAAPVSALLRRRAAPASPLLRRPASPSRPCLSSLALSPRELATDRSGPCRSPRRRPPFLAPPPPLSSSLSPRELFTGRRSPFRSPRRRPPFLAPSSSPPQICGGRVWVWQRRPCADVAAAGFDLLRLLRSGTSKIPGINYKEQLKNARTALSASIWYLQMWI
ncbi:hypothetical protein BRADI_1g43196v3, partial [Brachypodium distachyon]